MTRKARPWRGGQSLGQRWSGLQANTGGLAVGLLIPRRPSALGAAFLVTAPAARSRGVCWVQCDVVVLRDECSQPCGLGVSEDHVPYDTLFTVRTKGLVSSGGCGGMAKRWRERLVCHWLSSGSCGWWVHRYLNIF